MKGAVFGRLRHAPPFHHWLEGRGDIAQSQRVVSPERGWLGDDVVDEYDPFIASDDLVGRDGVVLNPPAVVVGPPEKAAAFAANPHGRIERSHRHAAAVNARVERRPERSGRILWQEHRRAARVVVARTDAEQGVGVLF